MMDYSIIEGAEKMELSAVMHLLRQTYWADERPLEQVKKSMENSRCFGVYSRERKLVGFARVISDLATLYYLCDVIVDEHLRGKGLGRALVSHIENLPEYQGLRGVLVTRDAHAFYEKFGYQRIDGSAMGKN